MEITGKWIRSFFILMRIPFFIFCPLHFSFCMMTCTNSHPSTLKFLKSRNPTCLLSCYAAMPMTSSCIYPRTKNEDAKIYCLLGCPSIRKKLLRLNYNCMISLCEVEIAHALALTRYCNIHDYCFYSSRQAGMRKLDILIIALC